MGTTSLFFNDTTMGDGPEPLPQTILQSKDVHVFADAPALPVLPGAVNFSKGRRSLRNHHMKASQHHDCSWRSLRVRVRQSPQFSGNNVLTVSHQWTSSQSHLQTFWMTRNSYNFALFALPALWGLRGQTCPTCRSPKR